MKSLFYLSFLFLSIFGKAQENNFTIIGKTNVNTFKCINKNFNIPASFGDVAYNKITLNVVDFNCKYDYITKDFRKTLSADKYPQIKVNFGKFKKNSAGIYTSIAEVKLMNKTKSYNIELTENGKLLTGKQQVKFSDFGIVPPKKMGGMVVVKDELELFFSFQNN